MLLGELAELKGPSSWPRSAHGTVRWIWQVVPITYGKWLDKGEESLCSTVHSALYCEQKGVGWTGCAVRTEEGILWREHDCGSGSCGVRF